MHHKLTLLGAAALLLMSPPARADDLRNNFWVNSSFESGLNLDQTTGTVSNWNRGGGDPTICQVISNNSISPTHALAVIDNNTGDSGYGEWYSDVTLGGNASVGDTLDIQWYEMYSLSAPEMRLTVLFFNGAGAQVGGSTHFVTTGTTSPGWVSTIEDSTFTKRNGSFLVPPDAVKMRCSLVSGGSAAITGTMVIDDLSVARSPVANLLPGNFWVNASFELGSDLDQTSGTVSNWNRGGGDSSIDQIITNNYASSTHALAVVDNNTGGSGYGEWYSDVLLSGNASPGDVLNLQWYEMYNLSGPEMRLTVLFFDGTDAQAGGATHFVTTGTNSPGWVSTIEDSTFTKRNGSLTVPAGAVKMRCSLVSGGSPAITGVMVIDDLSVARAPHADLLPGNFWVNSTFELGSSLDQTNGIPANWNRGGGDSSIDQVTTNNSTSPTHALAVVDSNTTDSGYGEWYSDVLLSGNAVPGDVLNIQWSEMYNLSGPEMRLTVLFFDAANAQAGSATHFVTSGTSSPGWVSTIQDSTFTKRNGSLTVPSGAVKIRCSLVSGGSATITGVMVIDDLSVALAPHVDLLPGNFWVNSTFEFGSNLDQTNGTPSNWNRGGGDSSIDQVITNNSTSSTHALAVIDNNTGGSGYGEWYSDVLLTGNASPGDVLNIQWSEMYQISGPEMRLTVLFFDAANAQAGSATHFVTSGTSSSGWVSTIEDSTFTKRNSTLTVPPGAVKMRCSLVSGGSPAITGVMVIDDLSVALKKPVITGVTADFNGVNLTWDSLPGKTYSVLFATSLGTAAGWTPLTTGLASGGASTSYLDVAGSSGDQGFYRVVQE